ncbi:ATP-binding protein [Halobacteriovorax sp. HLS]|uniref:ATP-binding protein n=1 Tax=Halobacteriovorax sp. HLS TaxID=2234000 RepID=UPI000FDB5772|nr:ATP-binding protein [Halobacteriovorax sp. HLS]
MIKEKSKKFLNFDNSKIYPFIFTVIFIIVLFQYSFSSLESIFYDLRIKFDWGISHQDEIVLITMDEESDQFLGESYPYTYASHEGLVKKLIKDSPRSIGYLVGMLEPDSDREDLALYKFKKEIKSFQSGGGVFRFGTNMDDWDEHLPPTDLKDLGYSLALLNVDNATFAKDDISRRALINISGEESFHLWMANKYRATRGLEALDATSIQGSYYLQEADATFALFRYYTSPVSKKAKIKRIPFHRVLVGNFPKGFFEDKIVLVGPSYISNTNDTVLTPFNREEYTSSKLAIHAVIIEAFMQNKTVLQIPKDVSYVIAILVALFLSIIITKMRPTTGLAMTLSIMFGIIFLAYFLFSLLGLWLYITHIVLTVFVVYYIWVPFRAIGEYQRRYAIQEETKLLKKVENLKQNFISLMSHDLKTPVAKIAGMADVMKQKNSSNIELTKGLDSIIVATKELNKFISSILDLTKVESRNISLNMVSKDINTILESTVEGLRYEASTKNVNVVQDLAPLYPIEFDINLMKRVFSNLVENAIKYSGEGSEVLIKTTDDEQWVYISISDNGVGIPAEEVEYIFEKFYRVKNDASHSIKGTGLGLYLVKYFVELHGGTISAESELGNGTTFNIKLKNQ